MTPRLLTLAIAAATAGLAAPALAQRTDPQYALTVYSSAQPGQLDSRQLANYGGELPGYGVVRDRRALDIGDGTGMLRFTDVAARMDPSTVQFRSLTDPDGTRVMEQNFEFDLVSSEKLLERYLGETITVEQQRGDSVEEITGELLSARGGITLRLSSGEVATLNSWSNIRYPSLPGGLITRPTLVWLLEAERGGRHQVEVGYETQGMTWWADYNAALDETDGCRIDLSSWVTLVNQSGASYPDASLKLVAGEVNRAPPPAAPYDDRVMMMESRAQKAGFTESQLFEYHLYTLGRDTSLPDNSVKQVELFPQALGVPCEKELVFTAAPPPPRWWGQPNTDQGFAATSDGQASAFLSFDNRENAGLGMALPAGRVRVSQRDTDGALQFIGEDVIGHTPRNERLSLRLGTAFDVVGERRQTRFRVDTSAKWIEESFEIEVRNRKEDPVAVTVREYLYRWSDWTITGESHDHERRDAQTVDFPIRVPADTAVTVSYAVRYSW